MKVLITGGAGFIGSNIVNQLAKDPEIKSIIVLDNLINGDLRNITESEKVKFIKGDICDPIIVDRLCKGIDVICHQAALGSVPGSIETPKDYILSNVYGFSNIIEAAKNNGIKKIIYASSSAVYGEEGSEYKREENIGKPLSPYGLSKRFDEMLARNAHDLYDIDFYGLRYFNVFGEKQKWDSEYSAVIPKFIKILLDGKSPEIYGDGSQSRDFVHVQNVVDINIHLIKNVNIRGSHILNIGLGESTTVNEMFDIIKEKLNSDINPVYKDVRKGDILKSLADISKAKEFGYSPSVDFKTGLEKTIDWFML
jgi:nucleoside-diphosphate-sugar epimerase